MRILLLPVLFVSSTFAMVQKETVFIPEKMQSYFTLEEGKWDNGYPFNFGWLKVPDLDSPQGKREVLIMLVGKSFYNPNHQPKDYKIMYVGHATHGHKFVLPRGLYFWRPIHGKDKNLYLVVQPTKGNKYSDVTFDWTGYHRHWTEKDCPSKWISVSGGKERCWEPDKVKYVHPSLEIAHLLEQLNEK